MKKQQEEKRIYVAVPETVQTTSPRGVVTTTVDMEPGRLIAQGVHLGRKIENERIKQALLQAGIKPPKSIDYEEITTIVLGVRNSKELVKVGSELALMAGNAGYHAFSDTNPQFYGTRKKVLTAIGTGPVTREQVEPAIGHLELYQ